MKFLRARLTYANVTATLAIFLALAGGTALAATRILPKNSVGSKQIKNARASHAHELGYPDAYPRFVSP